MTKRMWMQCFCLVGLVAACIWVAANAWACAICAPAGETTLVSRLAVARQVVLARPLAIAGDYAPVVAIKGALPEVGATGMHGVVDDRSPRLRPTYPAAAPKTAPELLALLSYSVLTQRWLHIGDVPHDRSSWLQQMAAMQPAKELVAAQWPARLQFFGPDLQHANPLVAQTAYEEVASAPYALMRQAFRAPSPGIKPSALQQGAPRTSQLLTWLQDDAQAGRHSLFYLLLGLGADPRSVDFLTRNLTRALVSTQDSGLRPTPMTPGQASGVTPADVSAMLAALIEIRGPAALPWVEQQFLTPAKTPSADSQQQAQRQTMAMAQAAVLALGVLGAVGLDSGVSGQAMPPALSTAQVVEVYANYIRRQPAMAGLVAPDLANWAQWQFAVPIARALENEASIPFVSRYAMVFYLLRNPRPEAKALVEKLRLAKVM